MHTYVISNNDRNDILDYLERHAPSTSSEWEEILRLRRKLRDAVVVPHEKLSPTIISLYSTAKVVDLERRETRLYTLVYPHEASTALRRLSLLSPLGTALIGCDEGNFFDCIVHGHTFRFAVKEVRHNQRPSSNIRS